MRFTVSALPQHYTDLELEALFLPFGRVSYVKVYYDPLTLKSRRRGIVEMPTTTEAEQAIKELQGKVLAENPLKFKIEPDNNRQQQQRPQRGGGNYGQRDDRRSFGQSQQSSYGRPQERDEDDGRRKRTRVPINRKFD